MASGKLSKCSSSILAIVSLVRAATAGSSRELSHRGVRHLMACAQARCDSNSAARLKSWEESVVMGVEVITRKMEG